MCQGENNWSFQDIMTDVNNMWVSLSSLSEQKIFDLWMDARSDRVDEQLTFMLNKCNLK